MPSAAEVVKTGIDLQKMDATLVQKVEELTLYVLQQQQRIDGLEEALKTKKNNYETHKICRDNDILNRCGFLMQEG